MQKRDKASDMEPRVGIFWLFGNQLIIDSTPLSKAQPYGDSLTHATGHIDYWSALQERGAVPLAIEYDDVPRGRVGYDKRGDRFFLRADKCILNRKTVVREIMARFSLPPDKTSTGRDEHYRCPICLKRSRHREED